MMENVQIMLHLLAVTGSLSAPHIIDDHIPKDMGTTVSMQQVVTERGGNDLRNVLMLGNGQNDLAGQPAHIDAIL